VDSRTKLAAGAGHERNHAIAVAEHGEARTGMTVVAPSELSRLGSRSVESTLTRLVSVPTSVVLLTMVTVTP